MSFFNITAFCYAYSAMTGTGVFGYQKSGKSWFSVVRGLRPEIGEHYRAISWTGRIDTVGSGNIAPDSGPENAKIKLYTSITVELVTDNKLLAYWVEENAGAWLQKLYGLAWCPENGGKYVSCNAVTGEKI